MCSTTLTHCHRASQRRIVFSRGDFAVIRDIEIARLDQIFIHTSTIGESRAFVMVTAADVVGNLDPLTGLPRLRLSNRTSIVGVSGIGPKRLYTIPIAPANSAEAVTINIMQGPPARDLTAGAELIHVNWNIQFL